jgi:hypothetical protein
MPKSGRICRHTLLAVIFYALAAGMAMAAPPPIEAFLKSNGVGDIELSPDGKYLAAVQGFRDNEHLRALMVYNITPAGLTLHKAARPDGARQPRRARNQLPADPGAERPRGAILSAAPGTVSTRTG